jgi:shikimate dehydrogenase
MTSRQTRVFAVLGEPVGHSLSPAMHNAAFRALGLAAVYVALPVTTNELGPVMRALARSGGGGNLTVPHKRAGARFVLGSAGEPLPSCNTFWGEAGELKGAETDSGGITAAWRELGSPAGAWLLLGTGGGALAAARAAGSLGAAIRSRSRSPERAAGFEREVAGLGTSVAPPDAPIGVVVNCTPLGLAPADPLPCQAADVPAGAVGIDLVYGPGGTPWTRELGARGTAAADGRLVLVGQGALAFECWFPGIQAPVEVMRAAVVDALG